MKYYFFPLLTLCSLVLSAQPTGTLRGTLTNIATARPIDSAEVALVRNVAVALRTMSDARGQFLLENVPAGTYVLEVNDPQFGTYQEDVVVVSGQETRRDLSLEQVFAAELDELQVTARRAASRPDVVTVTYDDVMRKPAAFDDPARLLQGTVGVTSNFDGANGLVVRGLAPIYTAWTIEGMEVVNPNHLSNAGTFNDLGAQTSGGTSAISAQIIDRATLYKGAAPTQLSNWSSLGVFDVELRKGNKEHFAGTAQLGLVGAELALEGPIKKGASSFLVNYRYSTVGILSKMGVTFGGEAITFQDAALHLNYDGRRNHTVSVFAILGKSSNVYTALADSADWTIDKHSQNINYNEQMYIFGASDKWRIGKYSMLHLKMSFSDKSKERNMVDTENSWVETPTVDADATTLFNFRASYHLQTTDRIALRIDVGAMYRDNSFYHIVGNEYSGKKTYGYIPLASAELTYWVTPKLRTKTSFGVRALPLAQLELQYQLRNSQYFYGQMDYRGIRNRFIFPLNTKVVSSEIGWRWAAPKTQVQAAAFHRQFSGVPVRGGATSLLSTADGFDIYTKTDPTALVKNYGIEVSTLWTPNSNTRIEGGYVWYRTLEKSSAFSTNAYTSSRFDGKWATNLSVAKEWTRSKNDKKTRTWGVSVQAMANGGLLYKNINPQGDYFYGVPSYVDTEWQPAKQPYFRTDARVYWRRFHRGYTSTLALDIQNLTNTQNPSGAYYDQRSQAIVTTYQLGLIPMLSYRVAF